MTWRNGWLADVSEPPVEVLRMIEREGVQHLTRDLVQIKNPPLACGWQRGLPAPVAGQGSQELKCWSAFCIWDMLRDDPPGVPAGSLNTLRMLYGRYDKSPLGQLI